MKKLPLAPAKTSGFGNAASCRRGQIVLLGLLPAPFHVTYGREIFREMLLAGFLVYIIPVPTVCCFTPKISPQFTGIIGGWVSGWDTVMQIRIILILIRILILVLNFTETAPDPANINYYY